MVIQDNKFSCLMTRFAMHYTSAEGTVILAQHCRTARFVWRLPSIPHSEFCDELSAVVTGIAAEWIEKACRNSWQDVAYWFPKA